MEARKLKIYEGSGYNYSSIPQILLQGKWLDNLGFSIGDHISVTCSGDTITIIRCPNKPDIKNMESEEMVCAK